MRTGSSNRPNFARHAVPSANKRSWKFHLWMLSAILGTGAIGAVLLWISGYPNGATVLGTIAAAVANIWIYWGLWQWRDVRWVQWAAMIIISANVAEGIARICIGIGAERTSLAIRGIWGMVVLFVLGLALIRLLLSGGWPISGVARTLIDEAIRMKIVLVFLVALAVIVPILPTTLDPTERLSYRIQFALTWSMIVASVTLSVMTVFLACGTVSKELENRHVFMSLTKPLGRAQYLLGKWLGIALLNLLLLSVSGVGIYVFAKMLQGGQAMDAIDRVEVDREVLVSRETVLPQFHRNVDIKKAVDNRITELARVDPHRYDREVIKPADRQEVYHRLIFERHNLGPRQERSFLFTGLDPARRYGEYVVLRLKPEQTRYNENNTVLMAYRINNESWHQLRPIPNRQFFRLRISTEIIPDEQVLDERGNVLLQEGDLRLDLKNVNLEAPEQTFRTDIQFEPDGGLEILYTVGNFETNLAKGMLVIWFRLCFLAALGLSAATFLTFPTACLGVGLYYIAASASGFIHESLYWFSPWGYEESAPLWQKIAYIIGQLWHNIANGDLWALIQAFAKTVASGFMVVVPTFSDYNPTSFVSDGRNVPIAMVIGGLLKVAIIWSVVVSLVGWLFFRKRELARVII